MVGPEAIERALAEAAPLRLVVHPRKPLSPRARSAVESARRAGVAILDAGDQAIWRLTAGAPDVEVLALAGPEPASDLAGVLARGGALWLLVGTAYPGNAGFVIRTAEVAGADGVVIDAAFDRPARRESLRASMRADRYLPVLFEPWQDVVEGARASGHRLVALETEGGRAPWEVDLTGPVLFAAGGERSGLPAGLLERADVVVRLPMAGFIASYNLQAAVAAVAAERLRQQAL